MKFKKHTFSPKRGTGETATSSSINKLEAASVSQSQSPKRGGEGTIMSSSISKSESASVSQSFDAGAVSQSQSISIPGPPPSPPPPAPVEIQQVKSDEGRDESVPTGTADDKDWGWDSFGRDAPLMPPTTYALLYPPKKVETKSDSDNDPVPTGPATDTDWGWDSFGRNAPLMPANAYAHFLKEKEKLVESMTKIDNDKDTNDVPNGTATDKDWGWDSFGRNAPLMPANAYAHLIEIEKKKTSLESNDSIADPTEDNAANDAEGDAAAADATDNEKDETDAETCCSKKSRKSKKYRKKISSLKKRRGKKKGVKKIKEEDNITLSALSQSLPGVMSPAVMLPSDEPPRARPDADLSQSLQAPELEAMLPAKNDTTQKTATSVKPPRPPPNPQYTAKFFPPPPPVKHTKTTETLVERVLRIGTLPEKYATSSERNCSALRVLLNELYRQGMDNLQVEDLLELIRWTTQYEESTINAGAVNRHHGARSFDSESIAQGEEHEALLRALLNEYQLRVKRQVRKWLSVTSFEQADSVFQNPEGHLVTSDPEDILYVIQAELGVALEYLPASNAVHLLVVMFRELELMQARIQYIIDTDGLNVDLSRLCAVVNDSCRMSEKVIKLDLLDGSMHSDHAGVIPTFEVKQKASQVEKGYLELAVHAAYIIETHIFSDIDPLLHKIFTHEWETGDLVPTSLATLDDYFNDLVEWMQPLFFGKCARRAFDDFLQHYMISFFAPNKKTKMSSDVVCYMLEKDRLYMIEFFGGERMLHVLKQSGLRDSAAIEDRVEILRAISNILKSYGPEEATDDISVVLRDLGNQTGMVAIMYLVQIRKAGQDHGNLHANDSTAEDMVAKWKAAVVAACKRNPGGDLRRRIACDLKHLIRPYHLQVFNKMNPFSEEQDFVTNMILMPSKQSPGNGQSHGHGHGRVDHWKSNMHKMKSADNWKSQIDKAKLKVEASVREVQERASFAIASNLPRSSSIRANYQLEQDCAQPPVSK